MSYLANSSLQKWKTFWRDFRPLGFFFKCSRIPKYNVAQNLQGSLIGPTLQSGSKKNWGSEKVVNSLFSGPFSRCCINENCLKNDLQLYYSFTVLQSTVGLFFVKNNLFCIILEFWNYKITNPTMISGYKIKNLSSIST